MLKMNALKRKALNMKALMAAGAVFAVMSLPTGAQAQGTWCAFSGGWHAYENCGYYSFRQCQAAVSGVGGACRRNADRGYEGPRRGYYEDEYDEPPPRRRGRSRY